ncbi:glucosaminidase domain-containing protein [Limosilactobacillus reuteri]|uniref:glucosaminidase domain-containing protein n=3 Tax=Limosilactobacillus reuteri TaxID=1598 RepID=UPI0009BCC6B3|nr:glucosaminidase domain-containing protein [Limosilactobacillus reuteri]MCH5380476.1 glucosaminidase domain-containing protein [Limosilactobacillus reuteri]
MSVYKHYKMFKKGKNWCCMAIATLSVALGALSISQHNVNADTTNTDMSSISTNTEDTQNSSENTVTLTTSAQSQDSQADATSTAKSTEKASTTNDSQEQNIEISTQNQIQSSIAKYVAISPKASDFTSQNGWETANGSSYYYRDGQKLTGQQNIDGKDYYFNDQGQQQRDYFLNQDNHTYYFQADGTRLNDGFYNNWGHTYYFQKDGSRLDNGFYNNWGHTYYFGEGGVRLDNSFYNNWGKVYYFGSDGALVQNQTINLGYGDLAFDVQGQLTSNNAFIGSIVNGAIQGWTQHQILPSLTLAQAILESAWGKSTLASTYHNLFGIKGSYNGMSVNMPTYEEYGGRMVLINDAFRRYPDNNASVQDHTDFLIRNSRYHNLIGVRDANTATYLIRADGYATASTYTSSLRNVINTYDLTRYDKVAFSL